MAANKLQVIGEAVDTAFFSPQYVNEPFKLKKRKGFAFVSVFKWEERKGWDVLVRAFLTAFTKDDDVSLHLLTHGYHDRGEMSRNERVKKIARDMGMKTADMARVRVVDEVLKTKDMPRFYAAGDCFVLPTRGEGWGRPVVEAMYVSRRLQNARETSRQQLLNNFGNCKQRIRSMALPVIVTNWSGPTTYLTPQNSYPLKITGYHPFWDVSPNLK